MAENIKKTLDKAAGWGLLILIVILLISLIGNVKSGRDINAQIQAEKANLAKLQAQNSQIETQIAETQSQDFIEAQIRNKLGLVKNGEAIVVLPDDDTLRKLAPPPPSTQGSLPDPNWEKWLKLFI